MSDNHSSRPKIEAIVFVAYLIVCITLYFLNEHLHRHYSDNIGAAITDAFIGICLIVEIVLIIIVMATEKPGIRRFLKGFLYVYNLITIALIAIGTFG